MLRGATQSVHIWTRKQLGIDYRVLLCSCISNRLSSNYQGLTLLCSIWLMPSLRAVSVAVSFCSMADVNWSWIMDIERFTAGYGRKPGSTCIYMVPLTNHNTPPPPPPTPHHQTLTWQDAHPCLSIPHRVACSSLPSRPHTAARCSSSLTWRPCPAWYWQQWWVSVRLRLIPGIAVSWINPKLISLALH